jgi:peptide/nickel transport system substrate-binding protein
MRIRTTGTRTVLAAVTALVSWAPVAADPAQAGAAAEAAGTPASHGTAAACVIDRVADSQSMDKTTVFDNESIWVFEQIMEPLYTVSRTARPSMPWLATSYTPRPTSRRTPSSSGRASSSRTASP